MENKIEIPINSHAIGQLENYTKKAKEYISLSKADHTKKAYQNDWNHFVAWCDDHGLQSLPASIETVALYLTALADDGYKTSTIQRRISAISQAHVAAGYDPISTRLEPLHSVWAGIRRQLGTEQKGKAPAMIEDIRAMVQMLPDTLTGIRDRALLLVGFAGAFRRSELVGLNVEDVEFTREGLIVTIRRSKTDQEGKGRKIGIPYGAYLETCPIRSLQAWLEASQIQAGPLFRPLNRHGQILEGRLSDKAVARVVKKYAEAAGLDPSQYAGHSLRAGFATTAARAGKPERIIMAQTGHKSVQMVRKYIREGSLFSENAAAGIGL